jgi:hypothetical protein
MQTRSSDNWKSKPGGWDSLNLDLLQSEEDYPEVYCTEFCTVKAPYIVNINDYKKFKPGCILSTFIDDYHLERFWNQPEHYGRRWIEVEAGAVMTPDYSLFIGMPLPMMMWNTYRTRMLGNLWMAMGVKVIPTVTWADEKSFPFCFNGIRKGSIVAVSDVGIQSNEERYYFDLGYHKMIEVIKPKQILFMSGRKNRHLYEHSDVVFLDSFFTKRRKQWEEEVNQKIKSKGIMDPPQGPRLYNHHHQVNRPVSRKQGVNKVDR